MPDIFRELLLGTIPHQLALRLILMPAIFSGLSWVLPNIVPISIQAHAGCHSTSHQLALRLTLMPGIAQWTLLSAAQHPAH